jgi:hypothetical protein
VLENKLYFHGSQIGNLEILEPRFLSRRQDQKGPRLYATPDLGLAAVFILDADDRVRKIGRYSGQPWTLDVIDRERFHDNSGWIYTLDGKGAIPVFDGSLEVYFEEPKKVLDKMPIPSALKFALEHGVRLIYR